MSGLARNGGGEHKDNSLKVQLKPRVKQRAQPPRFGMQRSLRLRHSSQEERVSVVGYGELVMEDVATARKSSWAEW